MTSLLAGRCTPQELATVQAAARTQLLSVSAYIRETVLAQAATDLEAVLNNGP